MSETVVFMVMSLKLSHRFVHDVLKLNRVSARWVPCQLRGELKERRVDTFEELSIRLDSNGDGFLGRALSGDGGCVHYHHQEGEE